MINIGDKIYLEVIFFSPNSWDRPEATFITEETIAHKGYRDFADHRITCFKTVSGLAIHDPGTRNPLNLPIQRVVKMNHVEYWKKYNTKTNITNAYSVIQACAYQENFKHFAYVQNFASLGKIVKKFFFNMVNVGDKIHICGYTLPDRTVEEANGVITAIDSDGTMRGTWGDNTISVNDVFYKLNLEEEDGIQQSVQRPRRKKRKS